MLNVPQVDALHVWRDVRWDGCEVPERAVHLGGHIAGAEPRTGDAAAEGGQAESEECPQPLGSASADCLHPAGKYYAPALHSKSEQADSYKENKTCRHL